MLNEINKFENISVKLKMLWARIKQIEEEFRNCESSTKIFERIATSVDYLETELSLVPMKELENTKIKLNNIEINLKQLKNKAQVDSFIAKAYACYSAGRFVYNIVTRNYVFVFFNLVLSAVGAARISSKQNENAIKCEELLNNLIVPINDCNRFIQELDNTKMKVECLKSQIQNNELMLKLKEENLRLKQDNLIMNEQILRLKEELEKQEIIKLN